MRLAAGLGVVAALALGGFAFAQEGLIVDPWPRAVSPLAPANPRPELARRGALGSPADSPEQAGTPAVVPVGPPLRRGTADPWGILPLGPAEASELVADPWVAQSLAAPSGRRGPADWAWKIQEIVDPWAKGPVAVVATDPLIVDPWAGEPRHRF